MEFGTMFFISSMLFFIIAMFVGIKFNLEEISIAGCVILVIGTILLANTELSSQIVQRLGLLN